MASNPFPQSKEQLLRAYRTMRTIREFEERLHVDFGRGDIPGFVHLYAGEEAAGTGIMMHLADGDRIASTHRGHGHCIAKGVDVVSMMKEIYGKKAAISETAAGRRSTPQRQATRSILRCRIIVSPIASRPRLFHPNQSSSARSRISPFLRSITRNRWLLVSATMR